MTASDEPPQWHPPSYHLTSATVPCLLSRTTLNHGGDLLDNFPRTAKWCGDGSSLMVQCENRSFQVFATSEENKRPTSFTSLVHSKTFPQSAPIVDFTWYPGASRHSLPAFCFVASVRDCPVKLLDGLDGRLRASYPIVDHRERYVAPHSMAFNLTADRLYCGFQDAVEVFDIQRPGEGERMPTTPSKKSKDGLKGIISALAFSYSPEYYAAGSLTSASHAFDNISLFNESASEPVLSIGGVAQWERGGVTQLMFNPIRPHILYAAFRRSERIWAWDLRGNASMPVSCFSRVEIEPNAFGHKNFTNQKLRFDVEGAGKWLAYGNQVGEIAMYDLENEGEGEGGTKQIRPMLLFDAHDDAVGAVAFHPLEPILLSVSGSRHFDDPDVDAENSNNAVEDSDPESAAPSDGEYVTVVKRAKQRPQPSVHDASMKLWSFTEGPCGVRQASAHPNFLSTGTHLSYS